MRQSCQSLFEYAFPAGVIILIPDVVVMIHGPHPAPEVDPTMWEAAAFVMGNSVRQWKATYSPTLRKRTMQRGISSYSRFTARVLGDEEGGEHEEGGEEEGGEEGGGEEEEEGPPPEFHPLHHQELVLPATPILVSSRPGRKRRGGDQAAENAAAHPPPIKYSLYGQRPLGFNGWGAW